MRRTNLVNTPPTRILNGQSSRCRLHMARAQRAQQGAAAAAFSHKRAGSYVHSILGMCFLHFAIYRQWDPFSACVLNKPMVATPVYVSRALRSWKGRKLWFLSEWVKHESQICEQQAKTANAQGLSKLTRPHHSYSSHCWIRLLHRQLSYHLVSSFWIPFMFTLFILKRLAVRESRATTLRPSRWNDFRSLSFFLFTFFYFS